MSSRSLKITAFWRLDIWLRGQRFLTAFFLGSHEPVKSDFSLNISVKSVYFLMISTDPERFVILAGQLFVNGLEELVPNFEARYFWHNFGKPSPINDFWSSSEMSKIRSLSSGKNTYFFILFFSKMSELTSVLKNFYYFYSNPLISLYMAIPVS